MSLQRRFTTVRKLLSEATLDFVARQIRLLFKLNDERILLPAVDFAALFTAYVNRYYRGILQERGGEKSLIFVGIN
jgi:hypothetical protein